MSTVGMNLADRFIVVSGNIGVGKSTLVSRLSAEIGSPGVVESHDKNAFLRPFYEDPPRWAFHVQAGFVALSACDYELIERAGCRGVLERSIEEHHDVFASELLESGALSAQEFDILERIQRSIRVRALPKPDLFLHLRAPSDVLVERIAARDRNSESAITPEYLRALNRRYEAFAADWSASPTVEIDTVAIDPRTDWGLEEIVEHCANAERTR